MGRLTSLEHRVMRLLVLGLANRAVAQELGITERVAERYILSVLKKLGLSSRAQLADCIRGQRRSPVGGDATATPNAVGERKQLTARELEVAALVGRGLTNREIGAELVITEGTAALHVKHILSKLGFTSRVQIAAWAIQKDARHESGSEPRANEGKRVALVTTKAASRLNQLTPREREVASLVARGLTNRETGAELVITEETAALHVKRILSKMGFKCRAQIAAWATREGPSHQFNATDLNDQEWSRIAPLLPPRAARGRGRVDDRKIVNGILWVLGSGRRWADLPDRYGAASTCHLRFQQWQRRGVWERVCLVPQEICADAECPAGPQDATVWPLDPGAQRAAVG